VWCEYEDLYGDDLPGYGGLEFPQINYAARNARPYRYFYGCGFRHLVGDSLLKMDLKDKSLKVGGGSGRGLLLAREWEGPTADAGVGRAYCWEGPTAGAGGAYCGSGRSLLLAWEWEEPTAGVGGTYCCMGVGGAYCWHGFGRSLLLAWEEPTAGVGVGGAYCCRVGFLV